MTQPLQASQTLGRPHSLGEQAEGVWYFFGHAAHIRPIIAVVRNPGSPADDGLLLSPAWPMVPLRLRAVRKPGPRYLNRLGLGSSVSIGLWRTAAWAPPL